MLRISLKSAWKNQESLQYTVLLKTMNHTKSNREILHQVKRTLSKTTNYLVTAPIDRPQRPILETCLLARRHDTAHLRSSF
jgi:hypothetical protein